MSGRANPQDAECEVESWREFMENAHQEQVWGGINTLHLLLDTCAPTTPTAKRLRKTIEQAAQIYEKRFGAEWLPF